MSLAQQQAFRTRLTPLFRAFWRLSRPMTLGVRGLVRDAEGHVLLVEHTYRPGWFLPGGGVEHGQTLETALAAELEDEAGVRLLERPHLFGVYSNHRSFRNDHVALYVVDSWAPCAARARGEIARRGFFPLDGLPAGVNPGVRARIEEVLERRPPDPHW